MWWKKRQRKKTVWKISWVCGRWVENVKPVERLQCRRNCDVLLFVRVMNLALRMKCVNCVCSCLSFFLKDRSFSAGWRDFHGSNGATGRLARVPCGESWGGQSREVSCWESPLQPIWRPISVGSFCVDGAALILQWVSLTVGAGSLEPAEFRMFEIKCSPPSESKDCSCSGAGSMLPGVLSQIKLF